MPLEEQFVTHKLLKNVKFSNFYYFKYLLISMIFYLKDQNSLNSKEKENCPVLEKLLKNIVRNFILKQAFN